MKSNITITPLRTWPQIPKKWPTRPRTAHYDTLPTAAHYTEGWRDVVQPPIGPNQKRGEWYYDEVADVVTYQVIDFTDEEIKSSIASQAEGARQMKLQSIQTDIAAEQLQAITDDTAALQNKEGYPLWSEFPDGHTFPPDFKVQDFEVLELKLFKVIQSHNKQSDWNPTAVPTLFQKVLLPGAALVWEPGIAVTVGEEYEYQGTMYTVIQSHTTQIGWEPPSVPSLWNPV